MGRRVVAYEGKETADKRLIFPGALRVGSERIPITTKAWAITEEGVGVGEQETIGWAEEFARNTATGEISFELYFKADWEARTKDDMSATILMKPVIARRNTHGVLVITDARIREIDFSIGLNAWMQ